jgi:dCTP deaminase
VMLSGNTIRSALRDHRSGFAITPILDPAQIADRDVGVDVRLGPDVIVTRKATGVVAFDPADIDTIGEQLRDYQEQFRRPLGSPFYLHPGEFALARTLEYVSVPEWLSAEAMGRSTWGRLGLIVATATLIQPGFQGTITLELANLGTVPIVLYIGLRVAQIVFHPVPGFERTVAQYAGHHPI